MIFGKKSTAFCVEHVTDELRCNGRVDGENKQEKENVDRVKTVNASEVWLVLGHGNFAY
jgi:hypothetical protein